MYSRRNAWLLSKHLPKLTMNKINQIMVIGRLLDNFSSNKAGQNNLTVKSGKQGNVNVFIK